MESMDFVKDLGTLGGKVVGSKGIKEVAMRLGEDNVGKLFCDRCMLSLIHI